jgi:protocatechuate 3,4-dioxygenase beta subunit
MARRYSPWLLGLPLFEFVGGFLLLLGLSPHTPSVTLQAAALAAKESTPFTTTGTITGLVTSDGGVPLVNAHVELYRAEANGDWTAVSTAETDATGLYQIADLAPARYRISFSDAPPLPNALQQYYPEYYDDISDFTLATVLTLTAGTTLHNINAQLMPKGQIHGVVVDQAGRSLSGIAVTVYSDANGDGLWEPLPRYLYRYPYITDSRGRFGFVGVDPGVYRLGFTDTLTGAFQSEFYADVTDLNLATDFVITRSEVISPVLVTLAGPTSGSQGIVTDLDGARLAEIEVTAYHLGRGQTRTSVTDANGAYTLAGLPPGNYQLGFRDLAKPRRFASEYHADQEEQTAATLVPIADEQTVQTVNASLSAIGRVRGVARDPAGQSLAGIAVLLYAPSGGTWYLAQTTQTASSGVYELRLDSGIYRVGLYDPVTPPRYLPLDTEELAFPVIISRGVTSTLDLPLLPLSALTPTLHLPMIVR